MQFFNTDGFKVSPVTSYVLYLSEYITINVNFVLSSINDLNASMMRLQDVCIDNIWTIPKLVWSGMENERIFEHIPAKNI